jgi:hypothetical protein
MVVFHQLIALALYLSLNFSTISSTNRNRTLSITEYLNINVGFYLMWFSMATDYFQDKSRKPWE